MPWRGPLGGARSVQVRPLDLSACLADAKLGFDDNAAFRQKRIYAMRDKSMEDARDVAAEEGGEEGTCGGPMLRRGATCVLRAPWLWPLSSGP